MAAAVALDAWLSRDERPLARIALIAKRGGLLAFAAFLPLAAFAIYYAARGNLAHALDRAVMGLLSYSGTMSVPPLSARKSLSAHMVARMRFGRGTSKNGNESSSRWRS